MKIKFVVDSGADLPEAIIEKYNLEIFPLYIYNDENKYKDGIDLTSKDLYKNMRAGLVYKTSQVITNDFLERFKKYAQRGETVIYPAFSSELSGTLQSALLAKKKVKEEYPEFDLTIIDTKSASMGIGLALYNVIKECESEDLNKEDIIERIVYYTSHMEHIFTVENLDYLVKGGRLNRVSGFVGEILNIKPILEVNNGELKPLERKKGSKKVRRRIEEIVEERGTNLSKQNLAVAHADCINKAEILEKNIIKKTNCRGIIKSEIGAVIGAHTGPGTYGIMFINENKKVNEIKIY